MKIETEALEKNLAWQHIKSILIEDKDVTFKLISEQIEHWVNSSPDKAVAELHLQHLLKQRYELLNKWLGIPEKILKSKVKNDSDWDALIRKQL